jgi:RNA polymerase sigma factor (sigma-70 family)
MYCFVEDRRIQNAAISEFRRKYELKSINIIKKRLHIETFQADMSDVIHIYDSMFEICQQTVLKLGHSNFESHWFYVLKLRIWGFLRNKKQYKEIKLTEEDWAYMKQFSISSFELSHFERTSISTPEDLYIEKEEALAKEAQLQKCLALLTPREQQIFESRAQGMTHKDIAIALKTTEAAIKTAWSRLMERIKG